MILSDNLRADLQDRLDLNHQDDTLEECDRLTFDDVLGEAFDGCDDNESPWWIHRRELRRLAIAQGIAVPVNVEQARESAHAGGASLKDVTWFVVAGIRYEYHHDA